jgi:hypothetical protein
MSAISGVSSPATHFISHAGTQAKTTPTPNQPASGAVSTPSGKDADGDKDGSVGTHINTFA